MHATDDNRRNRSVGARRSSRSRSRSRGRTGVSKRATAALLQQANNANNDSGSGGGGGSDSASKSKLAAASSSSSAEGRSSRGVREQQRGVSRSSSASSSSQSRPMPRRARSMRSLDTTGVVKQDGSGGSDFSDRSLSQSRHSSNHSSSTARSARGPQGRSLPSRSQSFSVRPGVNRSSSSTLAQMQSSTSRPSTGRQPPRRTKSACHSRDLLGGSSNHEGLAALGPDPDLIARRQRMKEMYRQNPSWEKNGQHDPSNVDGGDNGGPSNDNGKGQRGESTEANRRSMQLLRGSSHRHRRGSSWVDSSVGAGNAGEVLQDHSSGHSGGTKKNGVNEEQYLKQRQSRQDSILEVARKEKWEAQERKMAELDPEESHFDEDSDEESDEEGLKVKKKKSTFGKVKKVVKKTAKKTAKTSKNLAKNSLDVAKVVGSSTIDGAGKVVNKTSHLILKKKDDDDGDEYADYNPSQLASRQRQSSLLDRVISTDSMSSGYGSSGSDTRSGYSHRDDIYMHRDSGHSIALDSVDEEGLVDDDYSSDEED